MKAYVAAGLLLVAVPGPRGIDPRTLLLRPADISGGVVAGPPRPLRPAEYALCGAARVVRVPEAHAAGGAVGARPGFVSQAVFVFPTAWQAHRRYAAYVRGIAACPAYATQATVRDATTYRIEVRRRPYGAPRFGAESVAYLDETEVPGIGPQRTISVTVRTGRVLLLIGVSPGFELGVVVRRAVERARVLSGVG